MRVVVLLLWGHAAVAAGAEDKRLDGHWRIVQMTRAGKRVPVPDGVRITMHFRAADHTWRLSVEGPKQDHNEAGSWTLRGNVLTTRTDEGRKVEHIRISVVGKGVLQFHKEGEQLVLKRMTE